MNCERCESGTATEQPCCSSHGKSLCHLCYRRTHFVEVCVPGCANCAAQGLPVKLGDLAHPVTPPSADNLRAAAGPLLEAAGWMTGTWPNTWQRADLRLSFGWREIHVDEVSVNGIDGPVEVLHAVVSSVEQAVALLRAAGYLPAEPDHKPALVDSLGWRWYYVGQGEYVEKLTKEVWPLQTLEARRGPLTECPTDPGWSRLAAPALVRPEVTR